MTTTTIIHDDYDALDRIESTLDRAFTDEALDRLRKRVKGAMDEEANALVDSIQDDMAGELASRVQAEAKRVVTALLHGDDASWRNMIGATGYNGRSDGNLWHRPAADQHRVIGEKILESGPISLRRAIVEANRETLESERLKDLEDQVASLTAQVVNLNNDLERAREEARNHG